MKTVLLMPIAFILMFSSCEDNDYYPEEFVFDPDVTSTRLDVGDTITFTDYSNGVVSRSWTFNGGIPATSTEEEVEVSFPEAGDFTATIETSFTDGITQTKEFLVVVSNAIEIYEGYTDDDIFSFEDETEAMNVWAKWENDGAAELSIDTSQGADGTSQSAKVAYTTAGEVQIFTNEAAPNINARMDKTKTYVYSFWAKASENTTITAALENSSNTQDFHNYLWQEQAIGTEWTKYTFNIDPSGQPYDLATNVYIKLKMVADSTTEIWFDEFSLQEVVRMEGFGDEDIFSFEDETKAMDVWSKWENDGAADLSVDTSDGANGTSQSGQIDFTTAGEVQIFTNETDQIVNATIDKTKTYTYSFWAKANETTTITAALENNTPAQEFYSYLWQEQEIGTEWTKYSFEIDPSEQPYDVANKVYIKVKMQPSNASATIWFDEFLLEEN